SGHDFNRDVDHAQPLVVRKRRSFSGRSARNQEIDSGLHLPGNQVAQGRLIDRTVLMERSDQSSSTSTQLHIIKITLTRVVGKPDLSVHEMPIPPTEVG